MQETAEQYTERILGYQQGLVPLKVVASTPGKLSRLAGGKSRRQLAARPSPDRWSAAEIIAHLADAELVFSFRLRLTLGASGTLIQAYDQDVWAQFSAYPKQDPALSLEAYLAMRERNIRLLRSLPPEMWENYGMHEERGKETVTRLIEMMAGHDLNHLKQVDQILSSRNGRAKSPRKPAKTSRKTPKRK